MHLGGAQHGMGPGRSHAEVSHTPHGLMGIHMTPHGHPMDTPWCMTPHAMTPRGQPGPWNGQHAEGCTCT